MNDTGSSIVSAWSAIGTALGAASLFVLVGCASGRHADITETSENEVPVLLQDCPGPVQAALLAEAYKAGGVIGAVERETESDGTVAYEGTVTLSGGGEVEVEVAPDGRVLEVESP